MQTDTQKLRVLRARTDQDLLALLQRELAHGMSVVALASTRSSQVYAQAQKSYETVAKLLPRIPNSTGAERLRLEQQVKELRNRLDEIPITAAARPYPASFAS